MSIFTSKQFNTLDDLLVDQLCDLYDAEQQIVDALPKMSQAAHSQEVKNAFDQHLNQTKSQISRMEQVFQMMGKEPQRITCDGMRGIIDEGQSIVDAEGDADVRDAGLIAAAQKVEHYEICGYGTCRTFAQRLGRSDVADVLQSILNEEGETDKKLTSLAERSINVKAER
jgi:ferritin-like metal-binding protein YciE